MANPKKTTRSAETFANLAGVLRADQRAVANLVPPPEMLPSVWAENNIVIPVGNAKPGPIRFDNAPMQRGMLDVIKEPGVSRVDYMLGAQLGKTTTLQCLVGYHIAHEPKSQILTQPSEGDMATFLETKLKPMLEANPRIASKMAAPRGREGVNNSRMASYIGGWLMYGWAGSPKTARGRSAPILLMDEVDGYEAAKSKEGDYAELLSQRAATFGDETRDIRSSTPVELATSRIYKGFMAGDRRRYFVCCPHCGFKQYLKWSNVHWTGRKSTDVSDADLDVGAEHDPGSAMYRCDEPECGTLWGDGERVAALRQAEKQGAGWTAERPFKGHASFHAPEMASTFRRLRDIVKSYLSKLESGDLQTFVNVSLGWPFESGTKIDPDSLMARRYEYAAQVPLRGLWLSCGVDMQEDRLEYEVVAWGIGEESWSIQTGILWGDPLGDDVWMDLEDVLETGFLHESGQLLKISASMVDTGGTGGMTAAAYAWLQGKTGRRIFGIKGIPGWGRPVAVKPTRKQTGKKASRYADLVQVGVDEAKLVIAKRLAIKTPGPGYCHFPDDEEYNEEHFKQLTAERLVVRYVKGQPIREWHKGDRDRNEKLDCRVYAYAALKLMQPSFRRLADRMGMTDEDLKAEPTPEGETPAEPRRSRMTRGRRTPAPAPAPTPAARPERKRTEIPPEEAKPRPAETTVLKRPKRATGGRRGGWATTW